MENFLKQLLIFYATALVAVSATKMSSCTNSKGIYPNATYSINSYVCEATPCTCTLGCESIIDVNFQSPRYFERVKPNIHASCMGVELDYPLNQDNACVGFTNTQCPVVENEFVNYQYKLTIPSIFAEVTVTLRFSIIDEDKNEDVVCFQWDINVKKSSTCPP
ncbi:hypothetical protein ABEB36_003031 [Hypothenemus hampei]|uniref:MD-2-related lipid-recognition domain-containing protein n=1 Tax=Hypothenemus hampei TaxID=57062 RepID=A0ABD1F7U7_HYPHA